MRIVRLLFAGVAAFSLLLSAADAVIWARGSREFPNGGWAEDGLTYYSPYALPFLPKLPKTPQRPWEQLEFASSDSFLTISHQPEPIAPSGRWSWVIGLRVRSYYSNSWRRPDAPLASRLGLFPLYRVRNSFCVVLPQWLLFLALSSPLMAWLLVYGLRARRRRFRRARGLCDACGYDLRSSGDRCPECGASRLKAPPGAVAA